MWVCESELGRWPWLYFGGESEYRLAWVSDRRTWIPYRWELSTWQVAGKLKYFKYINLNTWQVSLSTRKNWKQSNWAWVPRNGDLEYLCGLVSFILNRYLTGGLSWLSTNELEYPICYPYYLKGGLEYLAGNTETWVPNRWAWVPDRRAWVHESKPEYLTGEPEYLTDEPEYLTDEPEDIIGEPEYLTGEHEYLTDEPEYMIGEHEYLTGGLKYLAGKPETWQVSLNTLQACLSTWHWALVPDR